MIVVQEADFDPGALMAQLHAVCAGTAGAMVSFVGSVRDFAPDAGTDTLVLEHYPGMCERELEAIAEEARTRWSLDGYVVVHRVGALARAARIVFVGVACAHRGAAFQACEFIIDALKTRAPFWKKEVLADGSSFWVEQRDADALRTASWQGGEPSSSGAAPDGAAPGGAIPQGTVSVGSAAGATPSVASAAGASRE